MDGFQRLLAGRLGYPAQRGAIAEAERATGIKGNVIGRWLDETAPKRPSPRNLAKIAPYLGVEYDELLRIVYSGAEAPVPELVSPHDRLFRGVDLLTSALAEIKAAAMAMGEMSQPNYDPQGSAMFGRPKNQSGYQDRRAVPNSHDGITYLGDRRLAGMGA